MTDNWDDEISRMMGFDDQALKRPSSFVNPVRRSSYEKPTESYASESHSYYPLSPRDHRRTPFREHHATGDTTGNQSAIPGYGSSSGNTTVDPTTNVNVDLGGGGTDQTQQDIQDGLSAGNTLGQLAFDYYLMRDHNKKKAEADTKKAVDARAKSETEKYKNYGSDESMWTAEKAAKERAAQERAAQEKEAEDKKTKETAESVRQGIESQKTAQKEAEKKRTDEETEKYRNYTRGGLDGVLKKEKGGFMNAPLKDAPPRLQRKETDPKKAPEKVEQKFEESDHSPLQRQREDYENPRMSERSESPRKPLINGYPTEFHHPNIERKGSESAARDSGSPRIDRRMSNPSNWGERFGSEIRTPSSKEVIKQNFDSTSRYKPTRTDKKNVKRGLEQGGFDPRTHQMSSQNNIEKSQSNREIPKAHDSSRSESSSQKNPYNGVEPYTQLQESRDKPETREERQARIDKAEDNNQKYFKSQGARQQVGNASPEVEKLQQQAHAPFQRRNGETFRGNITALEQQEAAQKEQHKFNGNPDKFGNKKFTMSPQLLSPVPNSERSNVANSGGSERSEESPYKDIRNLIEKKGQGSPNRLVSENQQRQASAAQKKFQINPTQVQNQNSNGSQTSSFNVEQEIAEQKAREAAAGQNQGELPSIQRQPLENNFMRNAEPSNNPGAPPPSAASSKASDFSTPKALVSGDQQQNQDPGANMINNDHSGNVEQALRPSSSESPFGGEEGFGDFNNSSNSFQENPNALNTFQQNQASDQTNTQQQAAEEQLSDVDQDVPSNNPNPNPNASDSELGGGRNLMQSNSSPSLLPSDAAPLNTSRLADQKSNVNNDQQKSSQQIEENVKEVSSHRSSGSSFHPIE